MQTGLRNGDNASSPRKLYRQRHSRLADLSTPTSTASGQPAQASLPLQQLPDHSCNGAVVPFTQLKVAVAMMKAFLAVRRTKVLHPRQRVHETVGSDLGGIYDAPSRRTRCRSLLVAWATTGRQCTLGAHIRYEWESGASMPFLKVVNDAALPAVAGAASARRCGMRSGTMASGHWGISGAAKNTGDRRLTHDMNVAGFDLFMRRVMERAPWTLFSPATRARVARQVRSGLRSTYAVLGAKQLGVNSSLYARCKPLTCNGAAIDAV
jgi:hypothetical protein